MWEFKVLFSEIKPKNSHVTFFSFFMGHKFFGSFSAFGIPKKNKGCLENMVNAAKYREIQSDFVLNVPGENL